MTRAVEVREFAVALELREARGGFRHLEGRAVPYDTWEDVGEFMERHRHGSFKRSLSRPGPALPLLVNHDPDRVIGHAAKWTHPPDGLAGTWTLNDSDEAQRVAQLIADEDMLGLSIGFADIEEPDTERGEDGRMYVTRKCSRLVEVSVTPIPAYVDAQVTMIRTAFVAPPRPELDVDRWWRILEGLRSS